MSRVVFMLLLNDVLSRSGLRIKLSDLEKNQLYGEVLNHFGLIGGLNVCEALEKAWQDPYMKSKIEDFILAWLRKRVKKVRGEYRTGII
ncbi:MAG: hypothetical protein QXJ19_00145 [Candidatus Bathyarchaeia archaeon]|nr:hypothetical protein [Candidatus Bathyarchaeota archaeon]